MSDDPSAPLDKNGPRRPKRGVPEGLWRKCPDCGETIFRQEADRQLGTCPVCDHHFYVTATERIRQVLDEGTFEEIFGDMSSADPLEFNDKKAYRDRIIAEQKRTGLFDAAVVWYGNDPRTPCGFWGDRLGIHYGGAWEAWSGKSSHDL